MIIVMTIIAIVSMVSYAPYNYYKNKSKLKNSASKITQLLYDSRNMAVNGMI
jgi:Tfp pilus assembly protein FimT